MKMKYQRNSDNKKKSEKNFCKTLEDAIIFVNEDIYRRVSISQLREKSILAAIIMK